MPDKLRHITNEAEFFEVFGSHQDAYHEWHRVKNLYDIKINETTKQVTFFQK